MKSDFEMIIREFPEDKPIHIYPIADVHYGAIEHHETEWKAFVEKIKADESAFVILGGDLINNNTRSSVGSPFTDTVRPRDQKRAMVEYLEPIKDRILCAVSGNHERRSMIEVDDDITYDIMSKLDLEDVYRQNAAFMKVRVRCRRDQKKYINTYHFAVTHGAGGGIYTGATVNRNERFGNVIDGLDCLIVGHTHKGTVSRPSKLVMGSDSTVHIKPYLVVSCESWQAYGSYAMQKMLLPADTARPVMLELTSSMSGKDIKTVW